MRLGILKTTPKNLRSRHHWKEARVSKVEVSRLGKSRSLPDDLTKNMSPYKGFFWLVEFVCLESG